MPHHGPFAYSPCQPSSFQLSWRVLSLTFTQTLRSTWSDILRLAAPLSTSTASFLNFRARLSASWISPPLLLTKQLVLHLLLGAWHITVITRTAMGSPLTRLLLLPEPADPIAEHSFKEVFIGVGGVIAVGLQECFRKTRVCWRCRVR